MSCWLVQGVNYATGNASRTSCLPVAILFVSAGAVSAAAEPVGTVTKVVNQAQIGSKTAVPGAPTYMDDRLPHRK